MQVQVGGLVKNTALAVGVLLALGGLAIWTAPLGALLPATRQMVQTTGAILAETGRLEESVAQVESGLSQVERQEALLAEQERLTRSMLDELNRQNGLGAEAESRLRSILAAEQQTLSRTRQAAAAAGAVTEPVTANARELERLAAATARIQSGSAAVNDRLPALLAEMEDSAENFAVVERVREAAAAAGARAASWWQRLWEWVKW